VIQRVRAGEFEVGSLFFGGATRPASHSVILGAAETALKGGKMARQIVFSPKAARPPPTYSQAVKAAGLVFVSGTAPTDPTTGALKGTTVQEQTAQCLTNIQAILEEAGSSLDKIVSVTIVLADEDDFAGMNEEWLKWFPSNPPARQGAKLPARIPGLKVSIAAIAEA
jgi:2-iminobutanoate/2-iminopropanoate deaminase